MAKDFSIKLLHDAKSWFYLAIFFLPLERVLVLNIGNTNIRFTHLFLLIAVLVWLIRKFSQIIKNKNNPLLELRKFFEKFQQISNLSRLIIIYFLILGLSFLQFNTVGRMFEVFVYTVFILAMFFFIPHFFHRVKEITLAIKVFFFSALVFGVFGLYQFIADMAGAGLEWTFLTAKYTKSILGFTRVQAFFIEPLYFADFLILPIVFCILILIKGVKSKNLKIFVWLTLILSVLNFILTNARGAFMAMFFILLCLLIFNYKKISKKILISGISIAVLLAIIFGAIYFVAPQSKPGRFVYHATHPFEAAAYEERKETISFAWQMFKEKPIIGHGPGSFGLQAPLKEWEVRENWKIVNNLYLELLAESGILGFLIMISFFIYLLYQIIKAYKKSENKLIQVLLQGFFLVILGILIQYNTFSVIYLPYVWIVIGLAISTIKLMPRAN